MSKNGSRTESGRQHHEAGRETEKRVPVGKKGGGKTESKKPVTQAKENERVIQESKRQPTVFRTITENGPLLPGGRYRTSEREHSPKDDHQRIKERYEKTHAFLSRKHDVEARQTSESFSNQRRRVRQTMIIDSVGFFD